MSTIATGDLSLYYSTTAGSAGNSTAGTPAGSLGKYVSITEWLENAAVFDDISGAENTALQVDYRCVFLRNTNSLNAWTGVVVYIASQVAGGADVAIGLDPTPASALGSSSAQAVSIANETIAPAGVTFTSPTSAATGLLVGTIAPGQCRAVWIRRSASGGPAQTGDGFTLGAIGDSGSL
jgi:hypothetical protein